MLKRFTCVALLSLAFMLVAPGLAFANFAYQCDTYTSGRCDWTLTSQGAQPVARVEYVPVSSSGIPDPCVYRQFEPQPPPGDAAWGGGDPLHGRLWYSLCPDDFSDSSWDGSGNRIVNYEASAPYYVADGDTPDAAGAVADPMLLVERARGAFELPAPVPVFGPDAAAVAVKVPVWLSAGVFVPVVQWASAGVLTAQVSAERVSTSWLMGEPVDPARSFLGVRPVVVCAGSGAVFEPGMVPGDPPCGYTYVWRSLKERTGGAGSWPVEVTATYRVTWSIIDTASGTQVDSGVDVVETTASTRLRVREWHGVLVNSLPG